jgi:hypothetical protein
MDFPDELRQRVARGTTPGRTGMADLVREIGFWDSAAENALDGARMDDTDAAFVDAVKRLVDQSVFEELGVQYRAMRLLAEAGGIIELVSVQEHSGSQAKAGAGVGRDTELDKALDVVRAGRTGVSIICVTGRPGMGKTEFAREVATKACAAYGTGSRVEVQLSSAGPPAGPHRIAKSAYDALLECLRALGVPTADIPPTIGGRRERYAAELADQWPVILIGDAIDAGQVLPLRPPRKGLVVVTSRSDLNELRNVGAVYVRLGPLTEDKAGRLVRACFRAHQIEPDDSTVEAIRQLCDGVPIAMTIVSHWMAATAHAERLSLASLVSRLSAACHVESAGRPRRRLANEMPAYPAVAAVFSQLTDEQRAVLHAVGLLREPDADIPAVCLGTGLSRDQACTVLDQLADLGLVERTTETGRGWDMQPLIADYACTQVLLPGVTSEQELEQMIGPVIGLHGQRCESLRDLLASPALGSCPSVRAWAEARWAVDRYALAATIRTAVASSYHGHARELAAAFVDLCDANADWSETGTFLSPALAIARDTGDHRLEARVLLRLGRDAARQGEIKRASALLNTAAESASAAVDPRLRQEIEEALNGLDNGAGRTDPYVTDNPPQGGESPGSTSPGDGLDEVVAAASSHDSPGAAPARPVWFGTSGSAP